MRRLSGLRTWARSLSAGSAALYVGRGTEQNRRVGGGGVPIGKAGCLVPLFGQTSVLCDASPSSPWDGYRAAYRGEVTPRRPQTAAAQGPSAVVDRHGGPFKSRWLRVNSGAAISDVMSALGDAEKGASTAVYVGIPDDYEHSGPLVAQLRDRGFKFHHFFQDSSAEGADAKPGELVYYQWVGAGPDMVPAYSTALEGVGVLVLSPEKDAVLLVWEYGNWKMITGNVDSAESMSGTVRREVAEEVGLELEETMTLMGGWQESKARDQSINNVFCVFVATAKSMKARVDGVEISEANWFPLSSLPTSEQESQAPADPKRPATMEWDMGRPGKNLVSRVVGRYLDVHRDSRGLTVSRDRRRPESRDYFQ